MLKSIQISLLSYAAFSYIIFALALAGIISPGSVLSGLAATVFVAFYATKKFPDVPSIPLKKREFYILISVVSMSVLTLSHILLIPPFATDDLIYHLYVPQQMALSGNLYFSPYNLNSNMPMLFEYPIVLSFLFGIPPFIYNFCILFMILFSLYYIGKNYFKIEATRLLFCILLFATTPVVYDLLYSAYVELFLTLLLTFAFYQFLRFNENRSDRSSWYLTCIYLGLACAVKYSAAFFVLIIFVSELFRKQSKKDYYLGAALTVGCFSPWYLKSWLLLGNPTFPLIYWLFDSQYLSVQRLLYYKLILASYNYGQDLIDYLLLPLRILAGWQLAPSPGQLGFGGQLSVYTVFCTFGFGLKKSKHQLLTWIGLGFFALWAFYSQQVRFLLVIIPILLLAGVAAIEQRPKMLPLFYVIALVALTQNAVNIRNSMMDKRIFSLVTGNMSRNDFLNFHLSKSFEFATIINSSLDPTKDKLFIIGNFGRNLYYNVPAITNTYYDTEILDLAFSKKNPKPSVLSDFLQQEAITHVLVDWNFYENFQREASMDNTVIVQEYFTNNAELVASRDQIKLYKLYKQESDRP